jgi:parvulin-like peptidyl-prolyl isomerase
LAAECLNHYGSEVLEKVINKHLIAQECHRRGVAVTREEVNAEIERLAKRFSLPVDQWLKMLKDERGISAQQYADDIIWPTLALRKLAGARLEVTDAELQQEYTSQYGEAVKCRLIVCDDAKKAAEVRAAAVAAPDDFGKLARTHSVDAPSASANGVIQPIRRFMGAQAIEDAAFALKKDEISPVVKVGNQYAILKCEEIIPPRQVPLERAKLYLAEMIRDRKMRDVAGDVFAELQKAAKVENIHDDPVKSRQAPDVAALINGAPIKNADLAEFCIQRHGEAVLEGVINRQLIEQECKRRKITVTEADLDAEIARAAELYVKNRPDGKPDVEAWLKMVTEQQGIAPDVYRTDAVWPTVALKKLVGQQVQVADADIQKGYEANFGPRARCRAIVFSDLRRAQQVWEMARKNPTVEYFGDLAEQYSVEASSRSLRGEVPPIQKHGGQPILEEKAFALKPGELSEIVQVGREQYVILFCEGFTTPDNISLAEVRDYIHKDVFEKKQRLAMADYFQKLQDQATVDNFLAGTSRSPARAAAKPPAGTLPITR